MRLALRFIGLGLCTLGVLLLVAARQLRGGDVAVGVLLGLALLAGAVVTLWWMRRTGGVHRIELSGDALVLHRAGFAGIERRLSVDRASIRSIRAEATGQGRAARWRLWLVLGGGEVELASVIRRGDDRRPIRAMGDLLGIDPA